MSGRAARILWPTGSSLWMTTTKLPSKPGTYTQGKDYPFDPKEIREFVKYSWFDNSTTGSNPRVGKTIPAPNKKNAYSYIKAVRYKGLPHEAGPLARVWVTNPVLSKNANKFLGLPDDKEIRFRDLGDKAFSIMGRHADSGRRSGQCAAAMEKWFGGSEAGRLRGPGRPSTGQRRSRPSKRLEAP